MPLRDPANHLHQFSHRTTRGISSITIPALVCALPLLLLFDPRSVFYFDWFNHLWIIEYFGEYIRRHGTPPAVLSTENLVGITMPIFYGSKFYCLAGVVSSFFGSAVSFRIIAYCSLLLQYWQVKRAAHFATLNRAISTTVATLVTWAIYPLTNLYNRSALTEFIAVTFLTSSLSCLFVLVLRYSRGEKSYYDGVATGFFYSIAAVTHPLTAVFGGVFLGSIALSALFCPKKSWFVAAAMLNVLLVLGTLSSWLYVVHRFAGSLAANDSAVNQRSFRNFFPDSTVHVLSLLSPIAFDARTLQTDIQNVATPYLDAQINIPLVLLGAAFGYISMGRIRPNFDITQRCFLGLMIVSAFLFTLSLSVAIEPRISAYLGGVFDILQFAYRLATYVNLAALTFLLAAASLTGNVPLPPSTKSKQKVVLGLVVALSAVGLVTKLLHGNAARFVDPYADLDRLARINELPASLDPMRRWIPRDGRSDAMVGILPRTFYSHSQYVILSGYDRPKPRGTTNEVNLTFLPASGNEFGETKPQILSIPSATLAVTNVQPFPWNELWVNGRPKRTAELVAMNVNWQAATGQATVLAVPLEAGQYTIQYRFHPSKTWAVLERVSFAILGLWFFLFMTVIIARRKPKEGVQELQEFRSYRIL
jgi:hypothetical protein